MNADHRTAATVPRVPSPLAPPSAAAVAPGERGARWGRRIAQILAPRMRPMRIRRFTTVSGRHPSQDKVLSYAMARAHFKAEHRLPETLAPNETWVRPFPLG